MQMLYFFSKITALIAYFKASKYFRRQSIKPEWYIYFEYHSIKMMFKDIVNFPSYCIILNDTTCYTIQQGYHKLKLYYNKVLTKIAFIKELYKIK